MNPTPYQMDAISELMNIGVGRAAGMLNQMLDSPISLRVPSIQVLRVSGLANELDRAPNEILSFVRLPFSGFIQGTAALVFLPESAAKLVSLLTGEGSDEQGLDSVRGGTLSEVGNIVINGVMGSIANMLHVRLNYGLPTYLDASLEHLFRVRGGYKDPVVVLAHTQFRVEDYDIEGTILLVFEVLSFDALLSAVDGMKVKV